MNPSQDIRTSFVQTSDGLVAQNDHAGILLSPVFGNMIYDGNHLIETTECNCLVRPLNRTDISLYIDNQPAETLGFLRDGHTLWGRLTTGDRSGTNDLPHLPLTDSIGCTHLRETHLLSRYPHAL